jgi:hypothetical protein
MTTTMARRLAIICLTFVLFAIGLWTLVESNKRQTHIGQFDLAAPCPQPASSQCRARI